MKKKLSAFYTVYAAIIIAVVIAILICFVLLWGYLKDYENSLPKHTAENVFTEYYESNNFDKLFENSEMSLSPFETKENFVKYMETAKANSNNDLTYYEVSSGKEDTKKYVVKSGDEKISDFTLKTTGEVSKHGFDLWKLDKINIVLSAEQNIKVSVLNSSKLQINGIDVSDEYIVNEKTATYAEGHMLEGIEAPYYKTYEIKGLLLAPEAKVQDKNGKESTLVYDEAASEFKEQFNYDDELKAKKLQITTEAAQVYAKYMTRDAYINTLSRYFDSSSDIYYLIRTSETYWFADHMSYEFKDIELSEYYAYSEDTFSCRFVCNYVITKTRSEIYEYPIDITMYFREMGADTMVYDLVTNS